VSLRGEAKRRVMDDGVTSVAIQVNVKAISSAKGVVESVHKKLVSREFYTLRDAIVT
jgi:hypothetical protein